MSLGTHGLQWAFLGFRERIKPPSFFFICTQTQTHIHTAPKSLARMTGDGQKQIMAIDRCLEKGLCVCVHICVYVCVKVEVRD